MEEEVIITEVPKVVDLEIPSTNTTSTDVQVSTQQELPIPPQYSLTIDQLLLDIGFDVVLAFSSILIGLLTYKVKTFLQKDNMLTTPVSKMISRLGPIFGRIFSNIYRLVVKVKTGKDVKGTGIGIIINDAVKETMELKYKVEPNDSDNPEARKITYEEYDFRVPEGIDVDLDIKQLPRTSADNVPKVD